MIFDCAVAQQLQFGFEIVFAFSRYSFQLRKVREYAAVERLDGFRLLPTDLYDGFAFAFEPNVSLAKRPLEDSGAPIIAEWK